MTDISLIDQAALAWFLALWCGYTYYADSVKGKGRTLLTVMQKHREVWMVRMLSRENRISDITILSTIMRSVGLFSSTTLFVLAGLLAILGAVDKAQLVVQGLPFVEASTRLEWEFKVLLLLMIFIYAFFKFAWSLRQFNYALFLVGAAPPPVDARLPTAIEFAHGTALIVSGGVLNFNRGVRAYYFGLAALSWFLHPIVFAVVTVWVIAVVYRREFRSFTLSLLESIPEPELHRGAQL
ncbi:MAG: DUF599 family protein [Magnetovibrio sp.]|nr:DUF599 family protein [Magnetovibrio sp.]